MTAWKIASLAASYTSVQFNMHLSTTISAIPDLVVKNAEIMVETSHFDGRLFSVPTMEEVLNCLPWRCRGDAVRNSVGAFARMFSTKELHWKLKNEVLEMMKREERGV